MITRGCLLIIAVCCVARRLMRGLSSREPGAPARCRKWRVGGHKEPSLGRGLFCAGEGDSEWELERPRCHRQEQKTDRGLLCQATSQTRSGTWKAQNFSGRRWRSTPRSLGGSAALRQAEPMTAQHRVCPDQSRPALRPRGLPRSRKERQTSFERHSTRALKPATIAQTFGVSISLVNRIIR